MIRHTSTIEADWLVALVGKYGEDVEKMTRDRKLNVWQKTVGEIKRACVFAFLSPAHSRRISGIFVTAWYSSLDVGRWKDKELISVTISVIRRVTKAGGFAALREAAAATTAAESNP